MFRTTKHIYYVPLRYFNFSRQHHYRAFFIICLEPLNIYIMFHLDFSAFALGATNFWKGTTFGLNLDFVWSKATKATTTSSKHMTKGTPHVVGTGQTITIWVLIELLRNWQVNQIIPVIKWISLDIVSHRD